MRFLWAAVALLMAGVSYGAEVTLNWTAPSQNTDGTMITDLDGFRVYMSEAAGSWGAPIADITDPTQLQAVIPITVQLDPGDNELFFVMTAYDIVGNESDYSNIVSKIITVTDVDPPSVPVIIDIQINLGPTDCASGLECAVQ